MVGRGGVHLANLVPYVRLFDWIQFTFKYNTKLNDYNLIAYKSSYSFFYLLVLNYRRNININPDCFLNSDP